MSTWTAPITWVNGAVTAAQMNTEIRDHLNFLKGALDLLTNSTTADTGTGMSIFVTRASAGAAAISSTVSGDAVTRYLAAADGSAAFGDGTSTRDLTTIRGAAGRFQVGTNGTANAAVIRALAEVGQEGRLEVIVNGDSAVRVRLLGGAGGVTGLYLGPGSSGPTKVVGERITGYTNPMTGTASRATAYDTATITLVQLAQRVMAIQQDLTTHGLIGA